MRKDAPDRTCTGPKRGDYSKFWQLSRDLLEP
jgi:hypothetical protein